MPASRSRLAPGESMAMVSVAEASPPSAALAYDPFMVHDREEWMSEAEAQRQHELDSGPFVVPRHLEQISVANDPFMTHSANRVPNHVEQMSVENDPFIGHSANAGPRVEAINEDVRADPFLTKPSHVKLHASNNSSLSFSRVLESFLGPGDPERRISVLKKLVVLPWLVFMWTLLLWLIMRHYSMTATLVLTFMIVIFAVAGLGSWLVTRRRSGGRSLLPKLPLSLMCLGTVAVGYYVGKWGWRSHWRQYWWSQTGHHYDGNSAHTPAGSRGDAAVLNFADANGNLVDGTMVDHARSVGFKQEHMYCVAPILDLASASEDTMRINYWAVGINCCELSGSFTCDDAREQDASYGVVMIDYGFPCPGCNEEQLRGAIKKAETIHGVVSAKDALFVRWVKDSSSVTTNALVMSLLFLVIALTLGFFACFIVGGILWYTGFGNSAGSAVRQAILTGKGFGKLPW
eukprot:TRINITY_DN14602_c0_g1_i1.p1 TRINITY_DN14602_c0_g1~~TRINITY_DN14602_c0_g1_i1.p1  ORF type:complete len:505 (-),score=62.26 TRINITY_DN14602_c0_g1_i1:90-1472(-)